MPEPLVADDDALSYGMKVKTQSAISFHVIILYLISHIALPEYVNSGIKI
jgi:hypothetical protein